MGEEVQALRDEVARLRAENDDLRARLGVEPPQPPDEPDDSDEPERPTAFLLLRDPKEPEEPGRMSAQVFANVTNSLLESLRKRKPEIDWRAEYDLARIPEDAPCYEPAQLLGRMLDGTGPDPLTFRVERDEQGEPRVVRRPVNGERDSERFVAGYYWQLQMLDDVIAEAEAAFDAGAKHHGVCMVKAADVVLAQLKLGRVLFEAGQTGWREALSKPRPEYNPPRAAEDAG